MVGVYGPGAVLNNGRYKIIKELNAGGTAIVYEAFDNKKNLKVALKVMNVTEKQFNTSMKLSKREVDFSNTIKHDNFVQLLDVFSGERQLVLVWELIYGLDLLDLLNEHGGIMSEEMAAFYFHQLLKGVLFMHESGFCHRDLKAENCMVIKKTQQLKIIDFGLARHIESAVTSTTGTPDYLAPELLGVTKENREKIDQRAIDVWAMGVILYLLVTGKYPFEDPTHPNSFVEVFKNIQEGRMRQLPENISPGLRDLLHFIFELDPMKRIKLKRIARNDWLLENAKAYAFKIKKPNAFSPLMGNSTLSFKERMVLKNNSKHKVALSSLPLLDKSKPDHQKNQLIIGRPSPIGESISPNEQSKRSKRMEKVRSFSLYFTSCFCLSATNNGKKKYRQDTGGESLGIHSVTF